MCSNLPTRNGLSNTVSFDRSGKTYVVADRKQWEAIPAGRRAILHEEYEVVDTDGDLIRIEKKSMLSSIESRKDEDQSSVFGGSPVHVKCQEIEFSKQAGRMIRSEGEGTYTVRKGTSGMIKLPFELKSNRCPREEIAAITTPWNPGDGWPSSILTEQQVNDLLPYIGRRGKANLRRVVKTLESSRPNRDPRISSQH
ncbi:MAG: hypothetical protein R3C03_21990 [Pirellulaceae bacterium]